MKCTDCVYYEICKDLIKAGFTGVNEIFPEVGACEVFNPNADYLEKIIKTKWLKKLNEMEGK